MTAASSLVGLAIAVVTVVVLRPRTRPRTAAPEPRPDSTRRRRASSRGALAFSRQRRSRALDQAMPDLLDLLVVTLQAGLPAPAALSAVSTFVHPVAAAAIAEVGARTERGDRFVDALDALVEQLGTRALGLTAAIAAAERWGLPLAPTVDRIADDARHHRRRLAEIEARRLPVRLSVPLVCCTLPSFVCIAIGPLVVGALSSLRGI